MIGRTATSHDTAALRWNTVMWIIANGAHTFGYSRDSSQSVFLIVEFLLQRSLCIVSVPHMGLQHFFNWQWASPVIVGWFEGRAWTKWLRKLLWIGWDSSVGIVTRYGLNGPGIECRWGGEIFRTRPDRPWGLPSLLYNGNRVSFRE